MNKKRKPANSSEQWLDLARYHSADTEALLQRHHQVENLIGGQHHSISEGYHCEILLRDYLRNLLPSHYSVDTGFIRGNPVDIPSGGLVVASPQIDILIHNQHDFSPIYRMGDLVVVVPSAVVAVIEVKKQLTSSQLKNALQNIAKTKSILMRNIGGTTSKIFSAVFGFGSKIAPSSKTYGNRLKAILEEYEYPASLPEQIVDAPKAVFDLRWVGNNRETQVSCLEACFIPPNEEKRINLSLQYFLHRLMQTTEMLELRTPPVTRFALPTKIKVLKRVALKSDKDGVKLLAR